jgi:hypothetical protein
MLKVVLAIGCNCVHAAKGLLQDIISELINKPFKNWSRMGMKKFEEVEALLRRIKHTHIYI